ncbi:MAG: heparinase II/III-family protein, partial [Tannerella sp.]|nr:heparinase II/III-family protein [Tannerella sp.]
MTYENKYLQKATSELLAISRFSDWNPSHFLDVAEMTMAASIGYDWLYNQLSDNERNVIKDAILRKGLDPSLENQYNSWLQAVNNWNQVCNAGMTYGALAIYEEMPGLAKTVIDRAVETIRLSMEGYAPAGAYPEGYGYWDYGTSFNIMFISALDKALGSDMNLSALPGFLPTAGYYENMTSPTNLCFNYADCGLGGALTPAMFWFALKQNDLSLLWQERAYLLEEGKKYTDNRLLPAFLIWGSGIRIQDIRPPKTLQWVGNGITPVALMRTSWTDPKAVFVGFKGGSASRNHAHMDAGSFVMEADGVRWASDLGMQDYNSLETKGLNIWNMAQNSERWQV